MNKLTRLFVALLLVSSITGALTIVPAGTPVYPQKRGKKPQKKTQPSITKQSDGILTVLDDQVKAWNEGDLEKFMTGYWNSPELTFYSSSGVLFGWDATLARYQKNYQAEGKEMGQLVFNDLDITMLANDSAVVRGSWKLTLSEGKELGGLFTLIFRQFKDNWKIIHDHTSANE